MSSSLTIREARNSDADRIATLISDLAREFILADAAAQAGFDGVTISEHHAGFAGYIPQPLLVVVQILERLPGLWAGPAPISMRRCNHGEGKIRTQQAACERRNDRSRGSWEDHVDCGADSHSSEKIWRRSARVRAD